MPKQWRRTMMRWVQVDAVEEFPIYQLKECDRSLDHAEAIPSDLLFRYQDAANEWYAIQKEIRDMLTCEPPTQ